MRGKSLLESAVLLQQVPQRTPWKTSKRLHRRLSLLSYSKAFQKPGLSRKGVSQCFLSGTGVIEEDQPRHQMLVFGGVHLGTEFIGAGPEHGLEGLGGRLLMRGKSLLESAVLLQQVPQRTPWKTSKRLHRRLSLLSYSKAFQKPGLSRKGVSQCFLSGTGVIEEDQPQHQMLVFGGIHLGTEFIGAGPEHSLEGLGGRLLLLCSTTAASGRRFRCFLATAPSMPSGRAMDPPGPLPFLSRPNASASRAEGCPGLPSGGRTSSSRSPSSAAWWRALCWSRLLEGCSWGSGSGGQQSGLGLHGLEDVQKAIGAGGGKAGLEARFFDERWAHGHQHRRLQALCSLHQQGQ